MPDLLSACEQYVMSRRSSLDSDSLLIRGAWRVQYCLRLTENDFPVLREFLLIQTRGFGSCHYEPSKPTELLGDCIGRNALSLTDYPIPYRVAALDAAAADLVGVPDEQHDLNGANYRKIEARSDIICGEAQRLARSIVQTQGRKAEVLLVGALGSILKRLVSDGSLNVQATDDNPAVVGRDYHGIVVGGGAATVGHVLNADIVIATGMTLTNGTIDGILSAAIRRNARVVMFSQTGANLVQPLLDSGVSTVVSEPYPFYLMGPERSVIRVYRSTAIR